MVQFADNIVRFVGRIATFLAMVALALLVLLLTASILSRMIGMSIPAVDDIASIMLAAVFAFGLAAAVGANEHLSIDLMVDALPARPRWFLMRFTEAVSIAVSIYLLLGVYHLFAAAVRSNQQMLGALPIPRYLPMGLVVTGVALFAIALTFVFIRNILSRQTSSPQEH